MKNLILTLTLLISAVSFGQQQILNGISLNAPNGFVKAGDLQWSNGNENVAIQSFKGSYTGATINFTWNVCPLIL